MKSSSTVTCVLLVMAAVTIDMSVAVACAGCQSNDECVPPGETRMFSQCIEWRCVEPQAGYYMKDYTVLGCPYNEICVPANTSVESSYPCKRYECYTSPQGLRARYISTGCPYNGECIDAGATQPTDVQCQQARCSRDGDIFTRTIEYTGCAYGDDCVGLGQTVDTDRLCKKVSCNLVDNVVKRRIYYTGCEYNDECVPAGQNRTTPVNCKLFTCEMRETSLYSDYIYTGCDLNGVCIKLGETVETGELCERFECHGTAHKCGSSTFFVGCQYDGMCIDPGASVPTDNLCQQSTCIQNGNTFSRLTEYTGCEDDGECHEIGGEQWESRKPKGVCVTKSCTKSGTVVQTNIEHLECEVTDAGGNKICLGDGEESDNECEKVTCQITQFANGTFQARTVGQINGCTDNVGECVTFGESWVDKNGDNCDTRICGDIEPLDIECKSRDNECHAVGSSPWGQYRPDGQCRSYQCAPHEDLGVVAEDVGEACSFSRGGCKAPGQSFIQVNRRACKERGCEWSNLYGSNNAGKIAEIVGCSDDNANCHPVGSYPITKRLRGELETSVMCSWSDNGKKIDYEVVLE